jgi:hypothetical protein
VVHRRAVDVGAVQTRETRLAERREVGVVGQPPVDLHRERGSHRLRHARVAGDERGVSGRGLEHDRRTGVAPRLEVEDHATATRQRILVDERLGATQAGLLGVGEHQHDVVAQPRTRTECTPDLQDR